MKKRILFSGLILLMFLTSTTLFAHEYIPDIASMTNMADVVVVVDVKSSVAKESQVAGTPGVEVVDFTVVPKEVAKGSLELGKEFTFTVLGKDTTILQNGKTYLIFLRKYAIDKNLYRVVGGVKSGIFEVTDGNVNNRLGNKWLYGIERGGSSASTVGAKTHSTLSMKSQEIMGRQRITGVTDLQGIMNVVKEIDTNKRKQIEERQKIETKPGAREEIRQ